MRDLNLSDERYIINITKFKINKQTKRSAMRVFAAALLSVVSQAVMLEEATLPAALMEAHDQRLMLAETVKNNLLGQLNASVS